MKRVLFTSLLGFFLLSAGCVSLEVIPPADTEEQPPKEVPQEPPSAETDKGPEAVDIRVLILRDVNSIVIKGVRSRLSLRYIGGGRVDINGRTRRLPLRFFSSGGRLIVNGRAYRGAVEVYGSESGMLVVNELPLESYLTGLINREISSRWPAEAVKAQAVIARTYALYQMEKRKGELFDLSGTFMDQVYDGMGAEDDAASMAVRATEGEVLSYNGGLALSLYHSNAGGVTEDSREVWAVDYPYLRSVSSPYDRYAPGFFWKFEVKASKVEELLQRAGYNMGEPVLIRPVERSRTKRVKSVLVQDSGGTGIVLRGEDLRRVLGYKNLKSTLFDVRRIGDGFVFSGRGSGHGVGLSQWGAKGMAERGSSYREILHYFYPGTSLVKVY